MSVTAAPTPSTSKRAIITPWTDAVCIGGASIVVLVLIFALRLPVKEELWDQFFILAVLLNQPHFMASYRLLYDSKQQVLRHKWASLYLPALLVAYGILTVMIFQKTANLNLFSLLSHVASVYLAWHYIGQTWGMMASFAYIGGITFTRLERRVLRFVLQVFFSWHIIIYIYNTTQFPDYLPWLEDLVRIIYQTISVGAHGSMVLGGATLLHLWYRSGRKFPIRVLLPLPALYLGYVLLSQTPGGLFVLQMSHSLQYMLFTTRIELNRSEQHSGVSAAARGRHVFAYLVCLTAAGWLLFSEPRNSFGFVSGDVLPIKLIYLMPLLALLMVVSWLVFFGPAQARRMIIYFILLIAAGWLVFQGPVYFGAKLSPNRHLINLIAAIVAASVNIHHFFSDGVIWRISNPRIRKELFRHLQESGAR